MTKAPKHWPRVVRDLYWAVASTPLLNPLHDSRFPSSEWFAQQAADVWPALETLAKQPADTEALESSIQPLRLGGYFEGLLLWWLQHSSYYQVLAYNQQVHQQGVTTGAFDYLVRERSSGQVEHWEVACKFYLQDGLGTETSHWYGPNRKDRLDLKLNHMQSQQIQLGDTDAGAAWLCEHNLRIDKHRIIVKGRLFSRAEQPKQFPDLVHPQHEQGWLSSQKPATPYAALQRQHWLSPIVNSEIDDSDITTATRSGCVCLARLDNGQEQDRGFVVPQDWFKATS